MWMDEVMRWLALDALLLELEGEDIEMPQLDTEK